MAVGAWIVVAMGALFGAQIVLHPAIALPAIVIAGLLLRRRLSVWARLLTLLVIASSAYRAQRAMVAFSEERSHVLEKLGAEARCFGRGEVAQSPIYRGGKFVLIVRTTALECERATMNGPHLVRIVGGPDGLARGDDIEFIAQLGPIAPLQQLELSNPMPALSAKGIVASGGALHVERIGRANGVFSAIDHARAQVRRRILASYVKAAESLGRALVLGENDLEPEEQLAFQKSGLSHLLAVSGTHLVLAVVTLITAMKAVLLRVPRIAARYNVSQIMAPLGALLSLTYADFAGGSGSAWRAAFMLSAMYATTSLNRRLHGLHALAYSILLGAIFDPLVGYDISFLLSAAATAGLIVIGPTMNRPLSGRFIPPVRFVLQALATTVSAMIPCAPLLLILSDELTLVGLVANVIAGPIGELMALPLCLLHIVSFPIPSLEAGLALSGSGALLLVSWIAKLSAAAEFARVALPPPTTAQFACLLVTTLCVCLMRMAWEDEPANRRGAAWEKWLLFGIGASSYIGLEAVAIQLGAPKGRLRVTAVDVGQGDALLVDLPDGRLMLIDGGGAITGGRDPGRFILSPLLRARRRKHIDIVVLTHPHPDHYGGLLSLLPSISVGEYWEAGDRREAAREGEVALLRKHLKSNGARILRLPDLCEHPRKFADAVVEVMGPCPDVDWSQNTNNQSIVLRIALKNKVAVLPGDAEVATEQDLVAHYGARLRANFLKLGHHGSRSSSSELWLRTVKPAITVASVGVRNRFGHPHASTLSRLAQWHIPLYRTDELGAIYWSTDGITEELSFARRRP